MLKKLLLIPAFLLIAFNANAEKPLAPMTLDGTTTVTAEEVFKLVTSKPDLIIIDSRRNEEYAKGHIEGSVSLLDKTMTEDDLKNQVATKMTPVLFYCNGARCMRSFKASKKAISWGYKNIYWFRGGWKEWQKKEMPVSR